MRNDTLFEAPLPHMASRNGTAYAEPEYELEDEWETPGDGEYDNLEFEDEWEMEEASAYAEPEFEDEWEMEEVSAYAESEFEDEWEMDSEDGYSSLEYSNLAEYEAKRKRKKGRFLSWLKRAWQGVKNVGKKVAKFALPIAGKVAGSMFGGPLGGAVGGALGSGLSKALGEAEMEVAQIEAEFFGTNEFDAEIASNTAATEAALAEVLVDQAAQASSDAEAEAFAGAALPVTIASMKAEDLKPYIPLLVQFYALLARMLMQQGVEGRQLLRTWPHQQRIVARAISKAARKGERIDGKKALGVAAVTARRVLGSGRATRKAMMKNVAVQSRAARPSRTRRVTNRESESYCPTCGSR